MLVLSIKDGGELTIGTGDDAVRIVMEAKGGKNRVLIDAPKHIPVVRADAKEVLPNVRS